MKTLAIPETPEEWQTSLAEVRAMEAQAAALTTQARAMRNALQALCSHPKTVTDNDPRDSTTTCTLCGKHW